MAEIKRKGARSIKDIPEETLNQLNSGEIETANLVEWLGTDSKVLLQNLLIKNNREMYFEDIAKNIDDLKKNTAITRNNCIGEGLFNKITKYNDTEFLKIISTHKSDIIRSWGALITGRDSEISIAEKLENIKPFASDGHFNVREEAWIAVRLDIISNLEESLNILFKWTISDDENIRRFASEVTRPRGVWCKHIEELKLDPSRGMIILEPLKSDNSKYVRDSVGNWLNDASKNKPEFVIEICNRWKVESDTNETKYIIKKALRTINKSVNT